MFRRTNFNTVWMVQRGWIIMRKGRLKWVKFKLRLKGLPDLVTLELVFLLWVS